MKKLYILLLGFLFLPFAACDEVAESDRYLPMDEVAPARAVLLEDFTGQFCVNCPDAHEVIDNLEHLYGDSLVIAVAIHAGVYGVPESDNPNFVGLMQPEGNEYADYWNIQGYPSGLVDRVSPASSNIGEWATLVRQALEQETNLDIDLTASEITGDSLSVAVTLRPAGDITGKLQVWVIENHIIAYQRDVEKGDIMDYEHNHVYRASVNGTWGEEVSLEANVYRHADYALPIKKNWARENLAIVAFVYNDGGVVQAAKAPLAPMNTEIIKTK